MSLFLQVSQMLRRTRYSDIVFALGAPRNITRDLAYTLIACSALLLFQGTLLCLRNVKSLSRFFSKRRFNWSAHSLQFSLSDRSS
jgi:hypothetical protein